MSTHKTVIKIALFLCLAPAVVLGFSYGRVEFLTYTHKSEFYIPSKNFLRLGHLNYIKVFDYHRNRAKVLAIATYPASLSGVSFKYRTRSFLYFVRTNGAWRVDYEKVIWSGMGSADGYTFPLYW